VPAPLRTAIVTKTLPDSLLTLTPVVQLAYIAVGTRAMAEGRRMVIEAEAIFESYWFTSPAVGFQLSGTASRSELRVGRGQTDSIESTSIVHRAEFLYGLTSAVLLSEAVTLTGRREVIGIYDRAESRAFLDNAALEIKHIIGRPAAPIHVDLSSDSLQEQVKANMELDAIRAQRKAAIRMEAKRDRDKKLGHDGTSEK
jgi:hypothetical protein